MIFLFAMVCGNLKAQFWNNNTEPFTEGNGSPVNPYIISTPQQLAYLAVMVRDDHANYATKNYKLNVDIELDAYLWYLPIGTESLPFSGKFDGNGKIISGGRGIALFEYTEYAEIFRLRLELWSVQNWEDYSGIIICSAFETVVSDCSIVESSVRTGIISCGFIGYAKNSAISNCNFSGEITNNNSNYRGGFIGLAENSVISNCKFSGNITSNNDITGGFIGYAEETTVSDCSFSGRINSGGQYHSGGFVGYGKNLTLNNCNSEGLVIGVYYVGGFGGEIVNSVITNCYSKSSISGKSVVGGFLGFHTVNQTSKISDCYAIGSVYASVGFGGGFIGSVSSTGVSASIDKCFSEAVVSVGVNVGGGFIGEVQSPNYSLTISDCYSISSTSVPLYAGGFIGNSRYSTITGCFAGGSVVGKDMVGGFIATSFNSKISRSASGASTEGDNFVGGFVGYLSSGTISVNTFTACFFGGSVEGNTNVGGFFGSTSSYYLDEIDYDIISDCLSVGAIIGENKTGGFIGENVSGNYENCYFDRQTTGIPTGTTDEDVEGMQGLSTSQLTQNSLPPGFSEDDWVAVAGYYPQLKVFAESDNATLQAHSALLAVPLKLANDTEFVSDVQTFFQLADKTPEEDAIIWDASFFEKVTIYNNTVYAEPSDAWRTLTLRSGELERSFKFRAPGGLLSADIIDVKSNHQAKDNMFTYLIECGSTDDFAYADLVLPPYASCTPGSPLILYANTPLDVTVKSINGLTEKKYTFVAEKLLPSDIFVQRWHDVLAINNNFTTNGGYNFTAYEWYKNGDKLPDTKGYIQISGNSQATYTAELTTQQGDKMGVCPVVVSNLSSPKVAVYPNPVRSGQTIRVESEIELNNAVMQLFNATGNLLAKQTLNASVVEHAAPDTPGTYVLQITVNGMPQTFKIAVE